LCVTVRFAGELIPLEQCGGIGTIPPVGSVKLSHDPMIEPPEIPECVSLLFAGVVIGSVDQCFQSEGTWYGRFNAAIGTGSDRAGEFIIACRRWHAALRAENDSEPEPFPGFADVIGRGRWHVSHSGNQWPIEDAPVFWEGGDVSWIIDSAVVSP
jgi:hypothetical protein